MPDPPTRWRFPVVDRIEMDRERFGAEYLARNRPVVISGGDPEWFARWTLEAIKARYGAHDVPTEETRAMYVGDRTFAPRPLGDLIDRAIANDPRLRWKGVDFFRTVPAMRAEFEAHPPPSFGVMPDSAKPRISTLWVAPPKSMSTLHHDGNFDNVNIQVSGKKLFVLIAPSRQTALYRYGSSESPLNPFAPDLTRFPRFVDAEPLEATLVPGDMLLVPKYWWHCVYAVEPSVNLSTFFSWRGALSPWRVLRGVPVVHRSMSTLAAELKARELPRVANAARRVWYAAYRRLVPRLEPQPRGELSSV